MTTDEHDLHSAQYTFTEEDYMRLLALVDDLKPIVRLCARSTKVSISTDVEAFHSGKVGSATVHIRMRDGELADFLVRLLRRCGFSIKYAAPSEEQRGKGSIDCISVLLMPLPAKRLSER